MTTKKTLKTTKVIDHLYVVIVVFRQPWTLQQNKIHKLLTQPISRHTHTWMADATNPEGEERDDGGEKDGEDVLVDELETN